MEKLELGSLELSRVRIIGLSKKTEFFFYLFVMDRRCYILRYLSRLM